MSAPVAPGGPAAADNRRHPNHRDDLPADLRRVGVPVHVREWVRRHAGAAVVSVRRLPGASSTSVHMLRLADGRSLVLRRYAWSTYREQEPQAPGREVLALGYARRHGLVVPELVAADVSGDDVGDGVPVVLMSRLPGRALASPDVHALAEALVAVHDVDAGSFAPRFFPWCRATSTRPPLHCRRPHEWTRSLELWRGAEPAYEPRFVHRDFHPGNVLWSRRRLSGIVDWANGCVGPVGVDVATCRWNLRAWAGPDAADAFVRAYEAASGRVHEPYWDLACILEDDWDLIDDPARVHEAEECLAVTTSRWG